MTLDKQHSTDFDSWQWVIDDDDDVASEDLISALAQFLVDTSNVDRRGTIGIVTDLNFAALKLQEPRNG